MPELTAPIASVLSPPRPETALTVPAASQTAHTPPSSETALTRPVSETALSSLAETALASPDESAPRNVYTAPSDAGMCGFPGCSLPEKHAGLHQIPCLSGKRKRENKLIAELRPPPPLLFTALEAIPELRFSEVPPHGVIWPPAAASRFGESLCCARGVSLQVSLDELADELIERPKPLPWGSSKSSVQSRSRKKLIWLDLTRGSRARAENFMLTGPNAAPRTKLHEELDASSTSRTRCDLELADDLRRCFHIHEPPLAFQPNFAHSDFPMHYDLPGMDGFGRAVATLNVKEEATILIDETLDHPEARWRFKLRPGDAWAMRGYARERCAHGVSVGFSLATPCQAGCRQCRVSLNLRCGAHTDSEVQTIDTAWLTQGGSVVMHDHDGD